jgi:WD40 repeat protein
MAPEQAAGGAVDGRADLFSLGVVLYRACTGRLPFTGPNPVATLLAVATRRPEPPGRLNPDVPPALSALILRLLAKAPEGRPTTAREVAEVLAELEQRPPAAAGRRRGRVVLAAGAAVAAVVVAALAWSARHRGDGGTTGGGAEVTQTPAPAAADAGPAPPVAAPPTGPARLLQIIKAPWTVGRCQALCFTPHGRRLVVGGYSTQSQLVDLEAGAQTLLPSGASLGAQITPDGQHVYCLNLVNALGEISLLSRKWVPGRSYGELYYPLQKAPYRVNCGAFTRDCTLALLGCGEYPPGPPGRISPTDLLLAVGPEARLQPPERGRGGAAAKDCVIRLLDLATAKVVAELEGHTSPVVDIAISADGGLALSCSFEGEALLWDLRKRCRLRRLGDADVFFLCGDFTPDGRQVLTASADHHLRLWDVASGAQRRLYAGHTALVRSLAVSPDGAWALSSGGEAVTKGRGQFVAGKDCAVIAWDLRRGGELFRFSDPTHLMDRVGISPDGRLAVTVRRADRDCVYVWGLDAAVPPPRTKE